jgi:hypothetical protein
MARDMASLLSQPSMATPPDAEPQDNQQSAAQPGSIQKLMENNPGAAMQSGAQGQPAPNAQMTNAVLRHMRIFAQAYDDLLKLDDIGKTDIKGPFVKTMARLLGDNMMSLPQTLQLMKSFPDNPLQQRQWVQQHYAQDRQMSLAIMMHHAQSFPDLDNEPPLKSGYDHQAAMAEVINHYKPFHRRNRKNG